MPGRLNFSRSSITSGVIKPKSSAMMGKCGNALMKASNSFSPGPVTHFPLIAVGAFAGISQ